MVKSGERFSDEPGLLLFDQASQNFKILGSKSEAMKSLFGDESGDAEAPSKTTGAMKSTFKIEINDDEKILRDKQQTTVYHTGAKQGPMIELDEEDRKEMEREALADIDEEGEVEEEDEEDDPDEDLDF